MAANYRETTMRQLVIQADPEWPRDSKIVPEYEFTPPDGYRFGAESGGFREIDGGRLVFKGDYTRRGPYSD